MSELKYYVKLDADDLEMSVLTALNGLLKRSGLETAAQYRVLKYLLDRRETTKAESAKEARSDFPLFTGTDA